MKADDIVERVERGERYVLKQREVPIGAEIRCNDDGAFVAASAYQQRRIYLYRGNFNIRFFRTLDFTKIYVNNSICHTDITSKFPAKLKSSRSLSNITTFSLPPLYRTSFPHLSNKLYNSAPTSATFNPQSSNH